MRVKLGWSARKGKRESKREGHDDDTSETGFRIYTSLYAASHLSLPLFLVSIL